MPSTENTTLQRIQKEISEVIEREKELRNGYAHSENNNNNENESTPPPSLQEQENPPPKSPNKLVNGNKSSNGLRLFTPNPNVKGVMQKFIQSRGKLALVKSVQPINNNNNIKPTPTWTISDFLEPPRVTEPGKCIRRGYVPVQERMRKEFEDLHVRELELKSERRKSQPDFSALVDLESPAPPGNLRAAKSMAQLYDADEFFNETSSAPASLKPALSLAELCDASDDEAEIPGSHSLIMQWEQMIQKNQQART